MSCARFVFLLLFFCLWQNGYAQPLPEKRQLSGRVIMTGRRPVMDAKVTIRRIEPQANATFWGATVLTDLNGEFSVPAEEGQYTIEVEAPGYQSYAQDCVFGRYTQPLRITLQRTVALSFSLLDSDGQPVRNRRAMITTLVAAPGHWQSDDTLQASEGVTTLANFKGACRLDNQEPGVYHKLFILVRGVGYAIWPRKVEITEGQTQHFEVKLQSAPGALRVRVVEEGNPPRALGQARVFATEVLARSENGRYESSEAAWWLLQQNGINTWDGDGSLIFQDLLPGRYTFAVAPPPPCHTKAAPLTQTVELKASDNQEILKEIVFRLPSCPKQAPVLQIDLRDERGLPLTNRDVVFHCQTLDETSELPLGLAELEARGLPLENTRQARTDTTGQVTLYPFWPGLWRVAATELNARVPFYGVGQGTVSKQSGHIKIEVVLYAPFK